MKRSRRELSIDMVIHRSIFKKTTNYTLPLNFMPKTGVSLHYESSSICLQMLKLAAQHLIRLLNQFTGYTKICYDEKLAPKKYGGSYL